MTQCQLRLSPQPLHDNCVEHKHRVAIALRSIRQIILTKHAKRYRHILSIIRLTDVDELVTKTLHKLHNRPRTTARLANTVGPRQRRPSLKQAGEKRRRARGFVDASKVIRIDWRHVAVREAGDRR